MMSGLVMTIVREKVSAIICTGTKMPVKYYSADIICDSSILVYNLSKSSLVKVEQAEHANTSKVSQTHNKNMTLVTFQHDPLSLRMKREKQC